MLKNEDTRQLAENMFNVLEGVTMDKHPVIQQIKDIMTNNRALGAMMSGSGPTVLVYMKIEKMQLNARLY